MLCNDHYKGSKWNTRTYSNKIHLCPKYAFQAAYTVVHIRSVMAFLPLFSKKNSKRVWNEQGRWLDVFCSTSTKWVIFTYQSLSQPFHSSINCRTLIVLQIMLIYRNANTFCLVGCNWLFPVDKYQLLLFVH